MKQQNKQKKSQYGEDFLKQTYQALSKEQLIGILVNELTATDYYSHGGYETWCSTGADGKITSSGSSKIKKNKKNFSVSTFNYKIHNDDEKKLHDFYSQFTKEQLIGLLIIEQTYGIRKRMVPNVFPCQPYPMQPQPLNPIYEEKNIKSSDHTEALPSPSSSPHPFSTPNSFPFNFNTQNKDKCPDCCPNKPYEVKKSHVMDDLNIPMCPYIRQELYQVGSPAYNHHIIRTMKGDEYLANPTIGECLFTL